MKPTKKSTLDYIAWFEDVTLDDVGRVGGKNAALGEMISSLTSDGIRVPTGFAITATAYRHYLDEARLNPIIARHLDDYHAGVKSLAAAGSAIRELIVNAGFPDDLREAIIVAYEDLCQRENVTDLSVAVRSSATAEDLPEASFAGQQESYLNVRKEQAVLQACRDCFASLYTDRAITYRESHGFEHAQVALSIGIQKMVRSDLGSAGVIFTLDTETGFPGVVTINSSWGLGENIVKGRVNPDEFHLFKAALADPEKRPIIRRVLGAKERRLVYSSRGGEATRNLITSSRLRHRFSITDDDALQLARWAVRIEDHATQRAGRPTPMDIEWALDGDTGEIFIVQARPETIHSRASSVAFETFELQEKGKILTEGRSVGQSIASGPACLIHDAKDLDRFVPGSILVADMTDPDWVPIMREAAGVVTDHGGRTCHAAIVCRELGVTCIVGTGNATATIEDGSKITVSCAEGAKGRVYEGALPFKQNRVDISDIPPIKTKIMMNLADPAAALRWWRLPCDGIGLARMEFIIANEVKIHPMALVRFDEVTDAGARAEIDALCAGYTDRTDYFVDKLSQGIAMIAASQHPRPAIVRMSDFKTNEYANLIGGRDFEPEEDNPMIGFRGASRYYSPRYREGFALECRAIRHVRETLGLDNVIVMIPFCRTLEEADRVIEVMAAEGLVRGIDGLQIYVMCEIPSNVILAKEFAERFDGFSIGSNDLTQLVLGVDRDSELLAELFDERNPAVTRMIRQVISEAHSANTPVGICGQAPSDHPEFAEFLVEAGIDSISLNPDCVISVRLRLAELASRT